MTQSVSTGVGERAPSTRYANDSFLDVAVGLGLLLGGLSIVLDQPGLAALLTIALLLLLVRHPA